MKSLGSLKLSSKLLLSFGSILVLVAAVGTFAVNRLAVVDDEAGIIDARWLPSVQLSSALNTATAEVRIAQYRHVVSTTPEAVADADRAVTDKLSVVDKLRPEYERLVASPQERAQYEQFAKAWSAYRREWDESRAHSTEGR